MIASERSNYIISRLKERETISLRDISRELGISEATARRDFEKLEQQGMLVRVHSGATRVGNFERPAAEPSMVTPTMKPEVNVAAKHLVAQRAAAFVQEGDCIFLDGGTSLAPMITCLAGKRIRIVTHNILIAQNFGDALADLFLVGGYYRSYHATTVGHHAEKMISQFHFDHAFFGCSGVDLKQHMAYNNDIDTIPVKEAAMKYSARNYLLIDDSKLDTTAYCRFSSLSAFDHVICNRREGDATEYPSNFLLV